MGYVGGRVWVDVAEGATAPLGSPDFEATTMNALEADVAASFDFKPGDVIRVLKDPVTGFWPTGYQADRTPIYTGGAIDSGVRITDRADVFQDWVGPDPSPAPVTSGTGGMRDGDERHLHT